MMFVDVMLWQNVEECNEKVKTNKIRGEESEIFC